MSTNCDTCPNDTFMSKCSDEMLITTKSCLLVVIKRGREISEIQSTKNIIFIVFLLFAF